MALSFNQLCFDIWNPNYERKGIKKEFKPIFTRYIGIPTTIEDYQNVLKTLVSNIEKNSTISIYFDNQIQFEANFNLINYINGELPKIDTNNIKNDDIVIFDKSINQIFINSLNYVIQIADKIEHFSNQSIKNNFISKLIIWTYTYIKNIDFTSDKNPKCIYYGNINRHEIYFLILLYRMTFDVIFINPLKSDYWNEIDIDKLSEEKKYNFIQPVKSLKEEIIKGHIIEYNESYLYQVEQQIDIELYTDGIYKPWQLMNKYPIPITKKNSLIDLQNNWNQPAKVRDGFCVKNNDVYIPCFFMKINGENKERKEYIELVKQCMNASIIKIETTNKLFNNWNEYESQMFSLTFSQLNDGTFLIDDLKKLPFYNFSRFNKNIQNLLLEKMNEFIKEKKDYVITLEKNNLLRFVMNVLFLNEDIIRLINNFDYANDIPKLILFLENENTLSEDTILLLGYLHRIGLDILIFDPSGMFHMDYILSENFITNIRLDLMNYNETLENIKNEESKSNSWFSKFKKAFK